MEIKKVRVHTCNQKIEGYIAQRCRCRKYISEEKASELIDDGYAQNVITALKVIDIEEACPICGGLDTFKKRCHVCKNTGTASKKKLHIVCGEDIYMRPILKTPRTATIEEEHIEYAFVKGDRDAIKRIELYHGLNQAALAQLGAALIDIRTREIIFEGTPEPEDNRDKRTGRKYDWGRTI